MIWPFSVSAPVKEIKNWMEKCVKVWKNWKNWNIISRSDCNKNLADLLETGIFLALHEELKEQEQE